MGKVVHVAKIPEPKHSPVSLDDLHAEVCYYYPAYTFAQARRLPIKRIVHLLNVARRLRAKNYYELVQIAAAPHTEKGEGLKDLMERYGREIRNG